MIDTRPHHPSRLRIILPALAATALLGGCATSTPQARVTRFHTAQPIERADIAIEPRQPGGDASLSFESHAAAVARALEAQGFRRAAETRRSTYVALVEVSRITREVGPARSPASIGIGLGTGGGHFGVGGSVQIPVGKPRAREAVRTELFVQIKRRVDGQALWEGRAETEADIKAGAADATTTIDRLADALFRGFPGESGKTITVK